MTERENELKDPGTWDFSQAVVSPGTKKARAVVSVAFARDDFERVARAAQQSEMKTSEFIRTASLEKAATKVTFFGLTGTSQGELTTNGFVVVRTSKEAPIYQVQDEYFILAS